MKGMFGDSELQEILDETDKNGDGEIDFEEFMGLMKNDKKKSK